MSIPKILECTLRDGSYAIDFQFTADDTRVIAKALERVGFDLIEIGHGNGMGASEKGLGQAIETDAAYMAAAAGVLDRARWGMFCIPGIATLEHIDIAADHGMGFIRIGTNVTELAAAEPYIARARRHGMWVASNLMKSYAASAAEFGDRARQAGEYGAEIVYLVDSAGGMLPADVARHLDAAPALRAALLAQRGS